MCSPLIIAMAQSAYLPVVAANALAPDLPRHSFLVRITHWIHAASFIALLVSGLAILLAHPRLYWGETGAVGGPALIDLPLPFVLNVPIRGPGRNLHFLSAWLCVLNGSLYVLSGILTQHFRKNLLPRRSDLRKHFAGHFESSAPEIFCVETSLAYNLLQRLSYLAVVFVIFPLIIWTGLPCLPPSFRFFPYS